MFRKKKIDKSQKAVETLNSLLNSFSPKKSVSSKAQYEVLFNDIYAALTSPEHMSKEDLYAAMDVLFVASGTSITNIQIQADHVLNKTFRVFFLKGQVQKVITILLNELNTGISRPWKSVSGVLTKLAYYIKYSRSSKSLVYLLHFLNSLCICIKRPEDGIHTCIEKAFPVIIKNLSPYLNDQTSYKEHELISLAVNNLELSGSAGRTAAVVIAELAKCNVRNILKVVNVICKIINDNIGNSNRKLMANCLLILRFIWKDVLESGSQLSVSNIQCTLVNILKLTASPSNEILIGALEAIEVVFSVPTTMIGFTPAEVSSTVTSEYNTPSKTFKMIDRETVEQLDQQLNFSNSPWGSMTDISMDISLYEGPSTERFEYDDTVSESVKFSETSTSRNESFVDPLINTSAADSISLFDAVIDNYSSDYDAFFAEKLQEKFPSFAAALIIRRFLCKRLGCDDNTKISHKVLAFKCLMSIVNSNKNLVHDVNMMTGDGEILNETYGYIAHNDDKLAIAAFDFYLVVQEGFFESGKAQNFIQFGTYLHQMLNGTNAMRIRGALEVIKPRMNLILSDEGLCAILFEYLINLGWCTYFLTQCSRLMILGFIKWECVSARTKSKYQYKCLVAVIDELGHEDSRIRQAASNAFVGITKNIKCNGIPTLPATIRNTADFSDLFGCVEVHDVDRRADSKLEKNASYVLEILARRTLSGDKLMSFVHGFDALITNGVHLAAYFKNSTLLEYQMSEIITLIEASSLNLSIDELVVVLNVLSTFVHQSEVFEVKNAASEQLSDDNVLLRAAAVYLRVLNLYYTVYINSKVQEENSTFLVPDSPLKTIENKMQDISHLVGTGIHQMKGSNYNDSQLLKLLEGVIKGSYKNFMESLDDESENRFLEPLKSCILGLSKVLSKFSFASIGVFLDELLLYLNHLMPFVIREATDLLCQLSSALFARNQAGDKVLLKRTLSLSKNDIDFVSNLFNDFAHYLANVSHNVVEELILAKYGRLYRKNSRKRNNRSYETITDGLKRFEKSSLYLVSVAFFSNNCPMVKCKILNFLCILLEGGVEYKLADPKKRIFEYATNALKNPQAEHLAVFPSLFNFLITLSIVDPSYSKPVDLENAIISVIDKTKDSGDASHVFPCIALFLAYNMSLNVKSVNEIQKVMVRDFDVWMKLDPSKVYQLWTLLLCVAKNEKNSAVYDDYSTQFVDYYCNFFGESGTSFDFSVDTILWAANAFFICSSNTFIPVDQLFNFLKQVEDSNELSVTLASLPVLFVMSQMEEERILLRIQALCIEPVAELVRITTNCLSRLLNHICFYAYLDADDSAKLQHCVALVVKLLLFYIKAENKIGHYIKENLHQFVDVSLIEKNKRKLSECFVYLLGLLIEVNHSSILHLLNAKKCCFAQEKNQILNLVIAFFKRADVLERFEESQLSRLVEVNEVGVQLLRMNFNSNVLDHFPGSIACLILQQQYDFVVGFNIDAFLVQFMHNVQQCKKNGIQLADKLKMLSDLEDEDEFKCYALVHNQCTASVEESGTCFIMDYIKRLGKSGLEDVEVVCKFATAVFLFNTDEIVHIINGVPEHHRTLFINKCFEGLDQMAVEAVGNCCIQDKKDEIGHVQKILNDFSRIAFKSSKLTCFDRLLIFSNVSKLCRDPFYFDQAIIERVEDIFADTFVICLIEYSMQKLHLPECFFTALTAFFSSEAVLAYFLSDYVCLEVLREFIQLLAKNVEQMAGKGDQVKLKMWKIHITTVSKFEMYKDEILELFISVQRISLLLQTDSFSCLQLSGAIENAFKSIIRLPLLSSMFVVPEVALKQNWQLNIDARSDRIFVPLVNIYILEDPAVLKDFSFRTLWLGWTNRCQFENYCTSLFGVLSTTPVGNELYTADSEDVLHRSINAVSIAVETITNLLIQSLLYPVPGSPVSSVYLTKYRESQDHEPFLVSKRGKQAAAVKCQLFQNKQIRSIFKENFEKVVPENEYGIGQSSLMYLWSMTGILEESGQKASKRVGNFPVSISDYMLTQTNDIDTASTLKALLDNFEHWFDKTEMPMSLKLAVIRSLIVLTDIIDDTSILNRILLETKKHLVSHTVLETGIDALMVFLFIKCVAILGPDSTAGETTDVFVKFVEATSIVGVQSENVIVRQYTLHGILYILQSYLLDDLPNSFLVIRDLIISELSKFSMASDVVTNCDLIPLNYEQILWATAFRFLEEPLPLDEGYKIEFISLVKKLYGDPRLSCSQKQILTGGIESLILHSAAYNAQLLPTILDCLSTCQLQPLHIRFSISSFVVCIFKDLQKSDGNRHDYSKIVDFNRLVNIMAAFSNQGVIDDIVYTVSSLLAMSTNINQLVENVTMLIAIPPYKSTTDVTLLTPFDYSILRLYGRILMICSKHSSGFVAELIVKQISPRIAVIVDDFYASFLIGLTLLSAYSETDTDVWIKTYTAAFGCKQDLKHIMDKHPKLVKHFSDSAKTVNTVGKALELFSLKTEDGENFVKNGARISLLKN